MIYIYIYIYIYNRNIHEKVKYYKTATRRARDSRRMIY